MGDLKEQGYKDYLRGVRINGNKPYKPDYLNGYHEAERITKCGFMNTNWNNMGNYKRL